MLVIKMKKCGFCVQQIQRDHLRNICQTAKITAKIAVKLEAHPGEQTQGNMDEVVDMDISDSEVFVIMLIFHCLTILNIVMNIFLHSLNLKFQEEGGLEEGGAEQVSEEEAPACPICLATFNIGDEVK